MANRVGDGTPGPGRPKGIPNKATQKANEAFDLAFEGIGGVPALTVWAAENPTEFFKLFARRITVDQTHSGAVTLVVHRDLPETALDKV